MFRVQAPVVIVPTAEVRCALGGSFALCLDRRVARNRPWRPGAGDGASSVRVSRPDAGRVLAGPAGRLHRDRARSRPARPARQPLHHAADCVRPKRAHRYRRAQRGCSRAAGDRHRGRIAVRPPHFARCPDRNGQYWPARRRHGMLALSCPSISSRCRHGGPVSTSLPSSAACARTRWRPDVPMRRKDGCARSRSRAMAAPSRRRPTDRLGSRTASASRCCRTGRAPPSPTASAVARLVSTASMWPRC